MGRSVTVRPPAPPPATFYHRPSNRYYTVDGNRMRRHQVGAAGQQVNVLEKSIDIAIGSGNHAVTYLTKTPQGRLLELPLSWYSRENGWAMSPGYDRADHEDFRREISDSCLFCHSNTPAPSPIGCERCHGPTAQHLQSPSAGTILNPAALPPDRRLEVCLQCHLQTASSGIQDSVRRAGRPPWSFQPGEALGDYKMLFDRTDSQDRLEINHAGYRLLQSACFRGSGGRLQCTTCHDPHTAKLRADMCGSCHPGAHRNDASAAGRSCESCHMPKRAPEDAVHTTITDHKISRRPKTVDAVAENHTPYRGKVVPFYLPADSLTVAAVNRSEDLAVYRKMADRDLNNAALLLMQGKILLRKNDHRNAVGVLERASRLDPKCTDCLTHLAVAHALAGGTLQALAILKNAVAGNPDHVLAWINLGIAYESAGNSAEAGKAYREALRLQPDSLQAKQRLSRLPK